MSIDAILNSSFPTAILAIICIGLILYGKYEILPKINKLKETEDELAKVRLEKDELFLKLSTTILAVGDVMSRIEKDISELNSGEDRGNLSLSGPGMPGDLQNMFVLLSHKIDKMESIIAKHPNNLEMSLSDISRTMQDINREISDLVKGYETIASTLLRNSGRKDDFVGMERLR